jgi:catechol 2,3-dioxygenase-like lactoylglutathione lyase family enzyme
MMPTPGARLVALCFDANDPLRLARFWEGVLGRELAHEPHGSVALLPSDDTGFGIRFLPTREPKAGPNRMHLDLTSTSLEDQRETVARSLELGARHIDVGQRPEEGHVVLADPEGNEFCVIEPGNTFLADCGFIGALSCDGSREVGYFWSEALGWPLVWDQDQETAIRSPLGGPKISWGGPPLPPKTGKNRLHLDLAPPLDGDQRAEVDRLASLGASRIDIGQGEVGWVVMADPDGNEFCVVPILPPWH